MSNLTNYNDLYVRGAATLLASWEEYARGTDGAALVRLNDVAAAVFPNYPEPAVYNNALIDRDLGPSARGGRRRDGDGLPLRGRRPIRRLDPRERRGNARRAGGPRICHRRVHPGDGHVDRRHLSGAPRGRAWAAGLGCVRELPVEVRRPTGLLSGADPSAFHVVAAQLAGEPVATAIAFDHDGDCGIFNMSTAAAARRRGLGTALTTRHLHDAVERGCLTASLQSTPMAERAYVAVGFRDLGRFLEYMP
jgi:ribosomal protein S18 acetylase RimI-like enzyme